MRKLLLVLLFVFFNSYASSDPLLVVTELSPPDQILVNEKVTGKGTEFIRAIFAKANLTPDIQMYPWARAFRLASTIQNTFIYTIARTKGREDNFHWIGPVSHFELAFVALKERDDIIINNTEEAKKYKIAMQRNDFSTDILTNLGFEVVLTTDIQKSYALLVAKKVDLIVDDPELIHQISQYLPTPDAEFKAIYNVEELKVDAYLAANKNTDMRYINALQKAFYTLKNTQGLP
ncbi:MULTISPECIES: transporter substrate-binding domain-containing protein [Pseudoalteromonas]|uniref:substrate-binding periplasmic protein n=1 Tax=Pseudoalteromonas TaxID=53246 RepID=UPI0002CAAF27|nr:MULTISPECIES: transporter substrate-binding domain-containing protein [Pseudoalteromonas]ENN99374.1 amino acid ABC transporter periplasmic protein [Pseudoalteromonas agarivorans S816]TMS64514.1 amino acid ABC transporter substrate-binding protein [Pseudoalteromonas sp. S1691]TMS66284.1 amino acid ABC transporter substrate-binding protein [Pseudoalteromonas sp. S1731]TMS75335.1 amino acid ABC transporter substrate-binding protein [Pseudoalteromonas sp. S1941]TMS76204.1 amino acid ABC transpo